MKLSLVLPASVSLIGCAAAAPPPAVAPIEAPPVTTTTAVCAASESPPAPRGVEAVPVNVTVTPPMKAVDPELLAAAKRMPLPEQTIYVQNVLALKSIDGKLRLHGRITARQIEVTLPLLTSQCEQTIRNAIAANGGLELRGKGRGISDAVPGYGYVSAYDLEDVSTCVTR